MKMSFADNRTGELWRQFMPKRKEIRNNTGLELYSVEVYSNAQFFNEFDPQAEFDKWAAVEVSDFDSVSDEMETLIIPGGLYAVFLHRGTADEAVRTYRHIYGNWLPNSDFLLDDRPHFAVMGEKYKNDDPNSEEEIWIPIIPK
jgi:AraC family transcriptional regulator